MNRFSLSLCVLCLAPAVGCTSVYETDVPIGCEEDDADMDGFLAAACLPVGSDVADCDDEDPDVYPEAPERCNDRDDDCDYLVDEGLEAATFYPDCDGDGLGAPGPVLMACDEALREPPDCDGAPGTWVLEDGDCDDADPTRAVSCGSCGSVDLLYVVDTTASTGDFQAAFAPQLARVLEALATGDVDGDGAVDAEPVADLHFGVVTADLGSRGFEYPSCRPADVGDDAILVDMPQEPAPGCDRSFPAFLAYDPDTELDPLLTDAACLAQVGTGGCLWEQPLEASLKAMTPGASPLRFHPDDELGHGDLFNAGFLRDDSVLMLTVLSDEDDCSAEIPELYDPASTAFEAPPPVRCSTYPEALRGIDRYTSGLLALREAPSLVYTMLAGIPIDRESADPGPDEYAALQGDDRMRFVDEDGTLRPSCERADGTVSATPPQRLVELGRTLDARGARTVLGSICNPSFDAVGDAMIEAALGARDARCDDP
ncbi:MAG TPA: MopE-related protein [Sandaracinaceae bacterium LLY-WYZ-13_1]|nr:MopE-related protein [Sandaracinaceae bacterium LLY-WYZ-13_1]